MSETLGKEPDETAPHFPHRKRGVISLAEDSIGVGWQSCEPLGKLANGQASVVLAYATEAGATLLDRWLFLPQARFAEDHRERWPLRECGIRNEVTF
jgi:hypothetical protein